MCMMLVTENLTKRYKSLVAVNDLNLQLEAGDVFGFIGPNGAGKTTTINMLAGLLPPTSGRALIDGVDAAKKPDDVKRIIGYMPEHFGVYEDVTVLEYLDFFAAAFGIRGKERRKIVDDVIALTDLGAKRNALVETLSRGMKQRLCLAQTLVHDPLLLLLDEPASGLDPRARVEMRELLRELQAMGKTILISSHILPELADFCNKIGVIEHGTLVASGPVHEVLGQVSQTRRIRIRTLSDPGLVTSLMNSNTHVRDLTHNGYHIELAFDGSDDDLAGLLETLVVGKARIVEFEEAETGLEEVFLRLTGGTSL